MVGVEPTGLVEPVFDLTVDDAHEFFANGILVHNSSDCLIYGRKAIARLFESGAVVSDAPAAQPVYRDPQGLAAPASYMPEGDGEFEGLLADPNYGDDDGWGNR